VRWYRKAAEQNLAGAEDSLGFCYYVGQGVAKDEAEAVKWFRKAAEQNYAEAQYNLGVCYDKGQGVAKDEAEAVKWITLAAAQGMEQANAAITWFANNVQAEQIAEGKRRANDWLKKWKRVAAASGSKP
jgi:TPR repeat protein